MCLLVLVRFPEEVIMHLDTASLPEQRKSDLSKGLNTSIELIFPFVEEVCAAKLEEFQNSQVL